MRSQADKTVSVRTALNRPLDVAPPNDSEHFTLCWRDRSLRINRRSFETAHDLMAALERLRSRDDVLIRDRRAA
jgi:hypothetical protein